jgi:hypothetical protein
MRFLFYYNVLFLVGFNATYAQLTCARVRPCSFRHVTHIRRYAHFIYTDWNPLLLVAINVPYVYAISFVHVELMLHLVILSSVENMKDNALLAEQRVLHMKNLALQAIFSLMAIKVWLQRQFVLGQKRQFDDGALDYLLTCAKQDGRMVPEAEISQEMRFLFELFDSDKQGIVEAGELAEIMTSAGMDLTDEMEVVLFGEDMSIDIDISSFNVLMQEADQLLSAEPDLIATRSVCACASERESESE